MQDNKPLSNKQPDEDQPVENTYQNYFYLRDKIQKQFVIAAPQAMDKGYPLEYRQDQAFKASQIIAPRTIKHIKPDKTKNNAITQKSIADAIEKAIDELVDNEAWFATVLPIDKKKKALANSIALTFDQDIKQRQISLKQGVHIERKTYEKQMLDEIPEQDETLNALKTNLQNVGFTEEQSQEISEKTLIENDHKTLQLGAAPPKHYLKLFLKNYILKVTGEELDSTKEAQIESVADKSHPELEKRNKGIGLNRKKIVNDKLLGDKFFNKVKALQGHENFKKITKAFSALQKVKTTAVSLLQPIYTIRKKITQTIAKPFKEVGKTITKPFKEAGKAIGKLILKGIKKVLFNLGLGSLVRAAEEVALSVSTVGAGIPLAIAQELASRALGKLGRVLKGIGKSWKKVATSWSKEKDPFKAAWEATKALVDTIGAGVGGIAGGISGTIKGGFLGALVGAPFFGIGALPGAIIGGLLGGLLGTASGAKKGYEFRKKLAKKALIYLLIKALLAKLTAILTGAAIGATIGLFIGGPIGAAIGFVVGGAITYFIPQISDWIKNAFSKSAVTITSIATGGAEVVQTAATTTIPKAASIVPSSFKSMAKAGIAKAQSTAITTAARTFNVVTGTASQGLTTIAQTTETIITNITAIEIPPWLSRSVLWTYGAIGGFAFIVMTVLIVAFYVHPTDVLPFWGVYGPINPIPAFGPIPYEPYGPYPYGPYSPTGPWPTWPATGDPDCPSGWPTSVGYLTQGIHRGFLGEMSIDIATWDLNIRATHTGISTSAYSNCGGWYVVITSNCNGNVVRSVYAHLASVNVFGGRVSRGQVIGIYDNTGTCTTGPHLHYGFLGLPMAPPYIPAPPETWPHW